MYEQTGRYYAFFWASGGSHAGGRAVLRQLLHLHGFETKQLYGGYDIDRPYTDGSPMIVAVAEPR